jgi:hypothetical protein
MCLESKCKQFPRAILIAFRTGIKTGIPRSCGGFPYLYKLVFYIAFLSHLTGFSPKPITMPTIEPTHITALNTKPSICSVIRCFTPSLCILFGVCAKSRQSGETNCIWINYGILYQRIARGGNGGRLAMSLPYRRKSVSRYLHRNFEAGFSGFRVKHGMVIVFLNTLGNQQG